tara:strand:- start:203 stop:349 length:147 start_codon:yes stop_codon:yes gene_type:complete
MNLETTILIVLAFISGFIIAGTIYQRWSDQAVKQAIKSTERRIRKENA